VVGRAEWPADALAVVRDGMLDVVSGEEGTGRRARVAGVAVAAKTGTAEHGPAGRRRKYGWMVAFAPVEAPRVTVAMVVEDAETGGATVGPRLQRVLLAVFADEIAAGLNAGGTP
jgi:cell division protein FtsI/penicillin-binding protein 2